MLLIIGLLTKNTKMINLMQVQEINTLSLKNRISFRILWTNFPSKEQIKWNLIPYHSVMPPIF